MRLRSSFTKPTRNTLRWRLDHDQEAAWCRYDALANRRILGLRWNGYSTGSCATA